jgi:hypothetical protein
MEAIEDKRPIYLLMVYQDSYLNNWTPSYSQHRVRSIL